MKSAIIKNRKVLARVYFCTKIDPLLKDKKSIIKNLVKDISDSSVGYAGFSKKQYLRDFLLYQIFDSKNISQKASKYHFDKKLVQKTIKDALTNADKILPFNTAIRIYIFPSFSSFTKQRMNGVSGYTPWKNTILVFIDPISQNWEGALKKTVIHEYTHAVSRQFHQWQTLRDSIVFEGVAENFVQDVCGGILSRWSSSLSREDAKKYFKKAEANLSSKDWSMHQEVFFKDTAFPLWSGYSIGYHLIKEYRQKHPNLSWIDLVQTKPAQIIKDSPFTK